MLNTDDAIELLALYIDDLELELGERWPEFLRMLDEYLHYKLFADEQQRQQALWQAIQAYFPLVVQFLEQAEGKLAYGEPASTQDSLDHLSQFVKRVDFPTAAPIKTPYERDIPSLQTVKTHANLQGEDYAYVGEAYQLRVKLSDQPQQAGAHIHAPSLEIPVQKDENIKIVQVKLYAPDFDLAPEEPGWMREIEFYVQAAASSIVTFKLFPQDRLDERYFTPLKVQFQLQGEVLGEATRRIEVLQNQQVSKTPLNAFPPAPGYPLDEKGKVRIDPVPTPITYQEGEEPIHLTITIDEDKQAQRLHWEIASPYLEQDDFPPGPYYSRNLGAEQFVKKYLAPFGNPGDGWPEDHMDMNGHLKDLSISILFDNLLTLRNHAPSEFWKLYEQALDRHLDYQPPETFTILFRTADTHIPWELMPISEEIQAGKMPPLLGSAHSVGRWLLESGTVIPDISLNLHGFTIAAPTYQHEPLAEAQAERTFIEQNYAPYILEDTPQSFINFMKTGEPKNGTGILHFAGHGDCCTDPVRSNWLYLTNKAELFSIRSASNDLGNRLGKLQPVIAFFNACNVGRAAEGPLGSNGGWGRALLHQKYKGYIGPLWSVYDHHAYDTARTFYTLALEDKVPLGEVMRQIRAKFTADNRLFTYLAYLYLGHPLAKIEYTPFDIDTDRST